MILGSTLNSLLVCIVEHLNHRTAPTPSIVWIRNGIQVDDTDTRITVTNAETAENGRLESTLRIDDFRVNDTGVYQCISIDDMAFSGEIITSTPHQLDAGRVEFFRDFRSISQVACMQPQLFSLAVQRYT